MRRLQITASYTSIMKTSSTVEFIKDGARNPSLISPCDQGCHFSFHFCFLRRCAQAGQFAMARKLRKHVTTLHQRCSPLWVLQEHLVGKEIFSGPSSQDVLNGALGDHLSNLVRPIIISCHLVCDGSGAVQGWPRNEGISFLDLHPAALASGTDAREPLGHYSIPC
jgi:hypothetical protein